MISLEELRKRAQGKRLTKEEREFYIQHWQNSRLSKSKFCKEEGINLTTFYSWFRRNKNQVSFVPVTVSALSKVEIHSGALLTIYLPNGISIEGGFALSDLKLWLKEMHNAAQNI